MRKRPLTSLTSPPAQLTPASSAHPAPVVPKGRLMSFRLVCPAARPLLSLRSVGPDAPACEFGDQLCSMVTLVRHARLHASLIPACLQVLSRRLQRRRTRLCVTQVDGLALRRA